MVGEANVELTPRLDHVRLLSMRKDSFALVTIEFVFPANEGSDMWAFLRRQQHMQHDIVKNFSVKSFDCDVLGEVTAVVYLTVERSITFLSAIGWFREKLDTVSASAYLQSATMRMEFDHPATLLRSE